MTILIALVLLSFFFQFLSVLFLVLRNGNSGDYPIVNLQLINIWTLGRLTERTDLTWRRAVGGGARKHLRSTPKFCSFCKSDTGSGSGIDIS